MMLMIFCYGDFVFEFWMCWFKGLVFVKCCLMKC